MPLSVALNPICPEFAVCGQIDLSDVPRLAALGYRSIINHRPDGEGGSGQPTSEQIERQARAVGMHYVHFPIGTPAEAGAAAAAYHKACAALPHPVVAFCRTGGRALALFQACGGSVGRAV